MNYKMAIFPIDYQTVTFARYAYLGQYEPIALISPELNVLSGSDISKLDGGKATDILLHSDYKQKIAESDVVYFLDSESILNDNLYKELINYAEQLNKEVIVSNQIQMRLKESGEIDKDLNPIAPKLLTVDVPIISVLTIGEKCGQPQTEFSLGEYFRKQGYKVSQIGTQEYAHLLGCLNLPSFLFDSVIPIQDKILMFNRFIYEVCQKENPDVIILGVPDPIMKYNDDILNGLGIVPFIIQNGVQSDIGVVNLYYQDYIYEYLNQIMNLCKYRLNIEAKYFGISNTMASQNMELIDKLEYLYVNSDVVKTNLKPDIGEGDYTLFSIYDEGGMMEAFQKIEQELLTNVERL